jgi:outer membrane protein insertion porin family
VSLGGTEASGADIQSWAGDVEIVSIRVKGLVRVPEDTVLGGVDLVPGQKVSQDEFARRIRDSIKRIVAIGYFSDVQVFQKDVGPGRIAVTYVVTEKFVVRSVALTGNKEIEEEDIRKVFSIREGRFLNVAKLVTTLRSIEELYQDKGYYLAEASYRIERDEKLRAATVHIEIKEQKSVGIARVVFVGNKELTDDELKGFMQTREQNHLSFLQQSGLFLRYFFQVERPADEDSVMDIEDSLESSRFESWSAHQDVDLQRVKWLYMTRGYVDVRLGQPRIALTADRSGLVITVDIQEGPQYTVGRVDILSQDPDGLLFEKEEVMKHVSLKTGETFNSQNVMQDTQYLSRRYMDKGYAFVSVSNNPYLDKNKRILDLTYVVQKGGPTYIGNVILVGNRTTADKVVRREMKISEGDLFHQGLIDRSKVLIGRLGFFEDVEIDVRPSSASIPPEALTGERRDYVDLVVSMKEKDTGIFQVGAGFSSLESYLFQARVSKNNFLGRGQTLSFQALMSSLRSIYMISFVEPYFLDSLWSLSFDLYNTATDYEAFTTRSLGGNTSLGYRFFDDYYVYLTYKAEEMETKIGGRKGYGGTQLERLTSEGVTTSLRASVAWDTRNNRIIPTKGWYNSVSFEVASPYLGGDSDFYRTYVNSRWYIPLLWKFVLRLNGTLGHITTQSDKGVPIFERFYVGGIFSVRGFQRNSLSPTIAAASGSEPGSDLVPFPLGGNKELIFNVELEIPIVREMGIVAVAFFDAGNAYAEHESLDVLGLRTSAGFGFRWWSPMGPLRFEWGFPLRPRENEESMVFEFTIGSAF